MKEYLNNDSWWNWGELELLAQSLGFPKNLFFSNVKSEVGTENGLSLKYFHEFLQSSSIDVHVHETFNHQDAIYNLQTFTKASQLITSRHLSFGGLRLARLSFTTYEEQDRVGLRDDRVTRALHLCGKIISPLKLQHMLRHIDRLISDRLMLYEYLDIVASAEFTSSISKSAKEWFVNDSESCEFDSDVFVFEEQCERYLDNQYLDSLHLVGSRQSFNETNMDNSVNVLPPLIDSTRRNILVDENQKQSKLLKEDLTISNQTVRNCQCNSLCACLTSVATPLSQNQVYCCPSLIENVVEGSPASALNTTVEWLVSEEDLADTKRQIEDLQWELVTSGIKYDR